MFPLAWAHPASAGSLVAEGPTLWSEWVAAAVYKSRGERDSPLQDVRRNRSTLKDFRADPPFPTNPTIRTEKMAHLSLLGNEDDIAIVVVVTTIHIRLKFQEDREQAVYNTISNVCFVMRGQR